MKLEGEYCGDRGTLISSTFYNIIYCKYCFEFRTGSCYCQCIYIALCAVVDIHIHT